MGISAADGTAALRSTQLFLPNQAPAGLIFPDDWATRGMLIRDARGCTHARSGSREGGLGSREPDLELAALDLLLRGWRSSRMFRRAADVGVADGMTPEGGATVGDLARDCGV